jgi:hypothetical protein
MKQFVQISIILLLCAAGFSACGAVSSSFLQGEGQDFLKAEPSRVVYGSNSEFDKYNDLSVYLYRTDGGLSRIPNEDKNLTTSIRGNPVEKYSFGADDIGKTLPVVVSYGDLEPAKYWITILTAAQELENDGVDIGTGGGGIIITGPGAP